MPRPILLTGADRSGTTLLFGLLGSHPDVAMVRRSNLWRWFDRRFGDLGDPANLEALLDALSRYPRLGALQPDWDSIHRRAVAMRPPSYGAVFRLLFEDMAMRRAVGHWGDKSLHHEHHADRIFDAWPDASMIHVVRDPRDRYASVSRRHSRTGKGEGTKRMASINGRWLDSIEAGERNRKVHGSRYRVIRYEDVAREPEASMRTLCTFLSLEYDPSMLRLTALSDHQDAEGNSTFEQFQPQTISTRPIGRYREVLDPDEVASVEALCRTAMQTMGYPVSELAAPSMRWRLRTYPEDYARTALWRLRQRRVRSVGEPVPEHRLRD